MPANVQTMAYTGKIPWHGLGVRVESEMTAAEAIIAGGLDWQVKKSLIYYQDDKGDLHQMPDKFVNFRDDNKKGLGIVGARYTDVQNKQCFSIMDAVVGEKLAAYHTVGALGEGEKVWMLMKTPGIIKVKGDDVIEKFFLLATSHDGSMALTMMFTPIRVVCQNTLNLAIAQGNNMFRARHSDSIMARVSNIQGIREQLGIMSGQYQLLEQLSQSLVNRQVKTQETAKFLMDLFSQKLDAKEEISTRTKNRMEAVLRLAEYGRGNNVPGIRGTAWALYNGVTEYVDYENGKDNMRRAESALFGSGAALKSRALELVTALV